MIHYTGILTFVGSLALLVDAFFLIRKKRTPFSLYIKLFILLSWLVYVYAFVVQDYSLRPVYEYSTHGLPLAFKIASSWASGGGSLFLFATVMSLVAIIHERYEDSVKLSLGYDSLILASLALAYMNGAFDYMNPAGITAGVGLNPLLKSPWIYPHPLSTFTGYALIASAAISLLSGSAKASKTLSRLGWVFLTAGIAIGGYWSYLTFGWGGYWAWDPVETAELTPWLVTTALFHAQVIGRRTSYLTQMLAAGSVFLAILVTRAGISPLHSFASPEAATTVVTLALTFILIAEGFTKLGGTIKEFTSLRWTPYRAGLVISYISLMAMFLITFSTLAVPSTLKLAGIEVNVPQMDSGVKFYHTALFPFALMLFASLPLCTLGDRLNWRELSSLIVGLTTVSGLLVYLTFKRDIIWSPASSLATNLVISALLPFVVTGVFSGLGSFTVYLRGRRNFMAGISFLHMAMAVTMLGILLSGPYAYNRSYFKEVDLPVRQTVDVQGTPIRLVSYSYSLYGGMIDAYTPYVGRSDIFRSASWSILFLATDFKEALSGYVRGKEKLSESGMLKFYNQTSGGLLIPGEFQGYGKADVVNMSDGRVLSSSQVLITLRDPVLVSKMTVTSRQNKTSIGVMLLGNFTVDGLSFSPNPSIALNVSLKDPIRINSSAGRVEVKRGTLVFFNMITQRHSMPKFVEGSLVAPDSTLLLDSATLKVGEVEVNLPYVSEDNDIFLYAIFSQGSIGSDIIGALNKTGLIDDLLNGGLSEKMINKSLTPECRQIFPTDLFHCLGWVPMPKLIPEGAKLTTTLDLNGARKEVVMRFDANGEIQGIHGLVAHVVSVSTGLDEVYMVFNPPTVKKRMWSPGYHELMIYYLHETFKGLSTEERLGLTSIFAAAYLKDAVSFENLFPYFVDLYELATGFSPEESVLTTQGMIIQVKVIPYVSLLWLGVALMIVAELFLLALGLKIKEKEGDNTPEGDGNAETWQTPPSPIKDVEGNEDTDVKGDDGDET